jgi:hypothetical protein
MEEDKETDRAARRKFKGSSRRCDTMCIIILLNFMRRLSVLFKLNHEVAEVGSTSVFR